MLGTTPQSESNPAADALMEARIGLTSPISGMWEVDKASPQEFFAPVRRKVESEA
jgi:hypothetical protein